MSETEPAGPDLRAVVNLIRTRRTIHSFAPRVPPRELVLEALDTARWVPNHHHTEPWRFSLLGARAIAAVVDLNTEIVRARHGETAAERKRARWQTMPGWLVVTCQRSNDAVREREDYAACCCAIQSLSLTLWAAGVGTKWSTGALTRDSRFLTAIDVDAAREFCVGLIWYGYAIEVPAQSRRPLAEVLRDVE